MEDNKKLNNDELDKVNGGGQVWDTVLQPGDKLKHSYRDYPEGCAQWQDALDRAKFIHGMVNESGRKLPKFSYCGGTISHDTSWGFNIFKCEKCGEWWDATTHGYKEVLLDNNKYFHIEKIIE